MLFLKTLRSRPRETEGTLFPWMRQLVYFFSILSYCGFSLCATHLHNLCCLHLDGVDWPRLGPEEIEGCSFHFKASGLLFWSIPRGHLASMVLIHNTRRGSRVALTRCAYQSSSWDSYKNWKFYFPPFLATRLSQRLPN